MKMRTTKLVRMAFETLLKNRGYTRVGDGAYSNVYAKGKDKRVIKVGFVNTDNYIHFAQAVGIRNRNKHLPKIYSIRVYDVDPTNPMSMPYYIVVMERLKHDSENGYGSDQFYRQFRKPTTRNLREVRKVIAQIRREYKAFTDYSWSNVMWRGDTPVVTDPIV